MTQTTQTVLVPQSITELQGMKVKEMQALVTIFKAEDTDCLPNVTSKSKKVDLLPALTEYMGFNEIETAEEVETAVQNEIIEAVTKPEDEQDVMDLGFDDTPKVETTEDPFAEPVGIIDVARMAIEALPPVETTGDMEVDSLLAELGLDGLEDMNIPDNSPADEQQEPEQLLGFVEGWGVFGPQEAPEVVEEKPKKARKQSIPMDAPIPVRVWNGITLGIYGNILDEKEEAYPDGHKFAGMTWEERKLERFNPKAHEVFRGSKGNMHLVYTNVGATYLMVLKKPDGTMEPVLEVGNKGRGHLRCKQIANVFQVAYNEKNDQEVISAEVYGKLVEQIELQPINLPGAGA